jgi:hypothetical protein
MSETSNKARLRRFLRLPSFAVALSVSVAVLVAFALWMFVDASFLYTLLVVQADIGLASFPGDRLTAAHGWGELGPRLLLFIALLGIGAIATVAVLWRTLIGGRQGRSLRALFVTTALIAGWTALVLYHRHLESAGVGWRAARALHGIEQDAAILLAKWPTSDGALPCSGTYAVDVSIPPRLGVQSAWAEYTINEAVGPWITRGDNGELRFDYWSQLNKVEYHPGGRTPDSFSQAIRVDDQEKFREIYKLQDYRELQPNWFLVRYVSLSWRSDIFEAPDENP